MYRGRVIAVAVTGVHFTVELDFTSTITRRTLRRIGLSNIIRILPEQ